MNCPGQKPDGTPCKAHVRRGATFCKWHDPDPGARERHRAESRRGGAVKAYGAIPAVAPIADTLDVARLDLSTAGGVVTLLGATLAGLARLPLDCRTANAIAQVATSQRAALEASALEARVGALETAARAGLHGEPPPRA